MPPFNEQNLHDLAHEANTLSLSQPARSWELLATAVAQIREHTPDDHPLLAQALWYLGRAANAWARPNLVVTALNEARALFTTLQLPGWVAACDWQINAQPWMRPNFVQAATELEDALTHLEQADFTEFIPSARQSLAMAYLLVGRFDDAADQLRQAEQAFGRLEDGIGLGLCQYTWGRYHRINSNNRAAQESLQSALDLFQAANAPILAAMTRYSQTFVVRSMSGNAQQAIPLYEEALAVFETADLPLWMAQCYEGLSTIYNFSGQLDKAEATAVAARTIYAQYDLPGVQATNLLNLASLTQLRGDYEASLAHLNAARALFERVGNRWFPAVTLFSEGEVLAEQGRYHLALQKLEAAWEALKPIGNSYRLMACAWRLANAWQKLGNLPEARRYLAEASDWFRQVDHVEWLPHIYLLQAEVAEATADRLAFTQQARDLAQKQGVGFLIAQTERAYGEALLQAGQVESALDVLATAVAQFAEMQMSIEEAASALALGRARWENEQAEEAYQAWQTAAAISGDIAPEITWQAEAEIAVATAVADPAQGLQQYQRALTTFTQLRRNLWQPALVGNYLQQAIAHMDRAVALASEFGTAEDVLRFSEESKAQTVLQRLYHTEKITADLPPAVQTLVAEIRWLQNQLGERETMAKERYAALLADFRVKTKAYQQEIEKLERQQAGGLTDWASGWETAVWQQQARQQMGEDWVALSYYLTSKQVYCVAITPQTITHYQRPLTRTIHFALRACGEQQCRSPQSEDFLAQLGDWLLPTAVQAYLSPSTTLLIAPHGALHYLPWGALRVAEGQMGLVETAVPVIVPSLQSVAYLWQRSPSTPPTANDGLVVAVSEFNGRYNPLSTIPQEIEIIETLFPEQSHLLRDEKATFANLQQQRQAPEWDDYRFLHVASHAFPDKYTGRLSGIALHDQDLWLDDWQQLAPLPPLVVFSACSGMQSLLHTGDEPLGLAITCLAAGGQQVVGSLWPVPDIASPNLMNDFYGAWQGGVSAPHALALMQREARKRGEPLTHWAGFQSVGLP